MAFAFPLQTWLVSAFPSRVLVDSTPHLAVVKELSQGDVEPLQEQLRVCSLPSMTHASSLCKVSITGKGVL
jgi:hypothetical protein